MRGREFNHDADLQVSVNLPSTRRALKQIQADYLREAECVSLGDAHAAAQTSLGLYERSSCRPQAGQLKGIYLPFALITPDPVT